MKVLKKWSVFILILTLAFILAACGSSGSESTNNSANQGANNSSGEGNDSGDTAQEPVQIRLGIGFAAEETLWLMNYLPEVTLNLGNTYTLEMTAFRANADRLNAYQAGQLDGGTIGHGAALMTAEQGVDLKVVASVVKDTPGEGFNNLFLASKDAGITSIEDLKGKTIGIPDFKAPTDLWARTAVRSAGLDPDQDVEWAITPIPAMGNAVETGVLDVGVFPQPFGKMAMDSGNFVEVFNAKTGIPVDEDFLVLFMNPEFLEDNKEAVKDFLADYVAVTKYYLENEEESRQILLDNLAVQAEPEVYINMVDYNRAADGKVNMEAWAEVQELILNEGWIEAPIDLEAITDMSLLPE